MRHLNPPRSHREPESERSDQTLADPACRVGGGGALPDSQTPPVPPVPTTRRGNRIPPSSHPSTPDASLLKKAFQALPVRTTPPPPPPPPFGKWRKQKSLEEHSELALSDLHAGWIPVAVNRGALSAIWHSAWCRRTSEVRWWHLLFIIFRETTRACHGVGLLIARASGVVSHANG